MWMQSTASCVNVRSRIRDLYVDPVSLSLFASDLDMLSRVRITFNLLCKNVT